MSYINFARPNQQKRRLSRKDAMGDAEKQDGKGCSRKESTLFVSEFSIMFSHIIENSDLTEIKFSIRLLNGAKNNFTIRSTKIIKQRGITTNFFNSGWFFKYLKKLLMFEFFL